jgi:hypothetical protein
MKTEFNHAANEPPVVWAAIVAVTVAATVWFTMHG